MPEPIIYKSQICNITFGENVKVFESVNIYDATINNNSFFGRFVEIQKGAVIGINKKIQSHAFRCEMVTSGEKCIVPHGAMFFNDTFSCGGPQGGDVTKWKTYKTGNHVPFATNNTNLPVEICNNVVIDTGAVVTKILLFLAYILAILTGN